MLDPQILNDLTTENTAHALRTILIHFELTAAQRAYIIAAIYYLEGTKNNG